MMWTTFWIILFGLCSIVQVALWLGQYIGLSKGNESPTSTEKPPVSVIMAVKNDKAQVAKHLPSILDQDYPDFEVIIIDDHSDDDLLSTLALIDHPRLSYHKNLEHHSGKKSALAHGISLATGAWIVTTDADCIPSSKRWLSEMMKQAWADVILGYSPTHDEGQSSAARWSAYEHWYVGLQYLSAAIMGRAYMGVGRNLAFKRSVFDQVGGYTKHKDIRSGDDDLFIQSLRSTVRVTINTHQDSWMLTSPPLSWRSYIHQKRRHLTTAPRYSYRDRFLLSMTYLSQLGWYISWIALSLAHPIWLLAITIRAFMLTFVAASVAKHLGRKSKIWSVILWDMLAVVIYTLLSLTYFKPKRDW